MTTRELAPSQQPAPEWFEQWSTFQNHERFLFDNWIKPATVEDFRGKKVLECGCGGGQHTSIIASVAESVTAVDLATADIAKARNRENENVRFVSRDIATMDLGEQFDVVVCLGAIHHTDDPDRTFESLVRHCRPGGKIIVWTYSYENNGLVRYCVEPLRRAVLVHMSRKSLAVLAKLLTALMYLPVHTIYRLPLFSFLPYFQYFRNFRRLGFGRNVLNVFDKMNAPQTKFTTRAKTREWFNDSLFYPDSISILHYKKVSYSLVGTKRRA